MKWHDGVEFTVHDLIFFWRVGWDDEIPWAHDRVRDIKHMEALDNYTLKTAWGIWEAEADAIDLRMVWPLPRHILEETYNADKLRFINHPYWTTEFVGLGPYRLARFEHGSHLELVANDDYVLGRPRIKHVQVRFFQDANVLISALLGGDAHLTLHGSGREGGLSMSDGITLGRLWSATREGKVIFNLYRITLVAIQGQPEFQRPTALADLRVRAALLHAIDRQTIVDQQFGGYTSVADAWVSPDDPDYSMMAKDLTRYPFDPSRAQRLLAEAGWQRPADAGRPDGSGRGADGILIAPSGARFELEYRATGGAEAQPTATTLADYWKRVGIETQLNFVPRARANDSEWMAKFPGVRNHTMVAAPVGGATSRYTCARIPSERNNWFPQSSNPAGYCTQEMERWIEGMETAFPFAARMEPFRQVMHIALRELPYLPLYFECEAVALRSNVGGINRVPPKNRGRLGMHAHTWTIQ